MKDKNKKIIETIIDMYGYATGIATAVGMSVILQRILKDGIAHAWHSTGDILLWIEILSVGGTIPFFVYKFFKGVIDRDKITRLLDREKIFKY